MNTAAKGSHNEHRSIRSLEADGYRCKRAAGSLGAWDVVAIGLADLPLVQVKTRDRPGTVETEKLRAFPTPANCRKILHRRRHRQRRPDTREIGQMGAGESK
ncbi:MAG TPA: hypothetical protein VIY49_20045 [Bryobacteraceae bacterium]